MQKNNLLCGMTHLVVVACVLWNPGAGAAESLIDNVTNGQMESAQARNMVLEQQVQTARLQQQLRQIQSGENPAGPQSSQGVSAPSVNLGTGITTDTPLLAGPSDRVRLTEIYGRKGALRARISLPRGGSTEIHQGDVIPGTKLSVTAVTPDVVRLSDGSELTF